MCPALFCNYNGILGKLLHLQGGGVISLWLSKTRHEFHGSKLQKHLTVAGLARPSLLQVPHSDSNQDSKEMLVQCNYITEISSCC